MKVRYFSDLHLEFIKPNKIQQFIKKIPSGNNDVCILAGDIGNPYQENYDFFMKFISNNFKKTFYIAGNHEYYNETKTIDEINTFMENYFQQFDNISFLNNKYEVYNNYCFIGTTLWSKITNPIYEINDIYNINNLDYIKYNKLNKQSVDFLQDAIQEHDDKCIIITHHMPSASLIDEKYKTPRMMPYNQWFYCDMDDFCKTHDNKIKYWIYGHTHSPSMVIKNNISFLCNPIGYPNENTIIDLKKEFILEV